MFEPIRTPRLIVRSMRAEDGDDFWRRRNDPEVAKYQNWSLPFPRERATEIVTSCAVMDGPERGGWWMLSVVDGATDDVLGDLAVHLSDDGHTAEVGYTFAVRHWGHGYAVEALTALVEYLFETVGITRAFGQLHPDNPASAMVLERTGFRFEGHTRKSFWLDGEVSDDWIYGMTHEDWEAWRDRPTEPPDEVRLVEVTAENVREVVRLSIHKTQESFVAATAVSLAQALVPPTSDDGGRVEPWYRAIEADGVIAGFVMVALNDAKPAEPYLWRMLIDRNHQRRGIGDRALDLVDDEMRSLGATAIRVSWVDGKGSPAPFYERRGFVRTGEVHGGETEGRKPL